MTKETAELARPETRLIGVRVEAVPPSYAYGWSRDTERTLSEQGRCVQIGTDIRYIVDTKSFHRFCDVVLREMGGKLAIWATLRGAIAEAWSEVVEAGMNNATPSP